jgi:hypothetical protein
MRKLSSENGSTMYLDNDLGQLHGCDGLLHVVFFSGRGHLESSRPEVASVGVLCTLVREVRSVLATACAHSGRRCTMNTAHRSEVPFRCSLCVALKHL